MTAEIMLDQLAARGAADIQVDQPRGANPSYLHTSTLTLYANKTLWLFDRDRQQITDTYIN